MKKGVVDNQRSSRTGSRRKRGTSRLFVLGAAFMASTAAHSVGASPAYTATSEPAVAPGARVAGRAARTVAQSRTRTSGVLSLRQTMAQGPNSAAAQVTPSTARFDVAAGPLSDALKTFEATTGIRVVLALDSISVIQSPGATGVLSAEQALQAMLSGTGVTFRFDGPTSVILELRAQGESVQVSGRLAAVASPKYVVPLRDIAQTVALIPRATMEEQGATTLSEVLRNVPGITMQAGEGGGSSSTTGDMFNMRGFNASNSLFVDGVRDDGLISRDVFNLEQVEVFMGPTGSDVGRGTAAGYVNMQTKTPRLDAAQAANIGFGSSGQKRMALDFNVPFPGAQRSGWLNKSAIRVNALVQNSGVAGRDEVKLENRAIAPSIAMGLGTSTRVSVSAQIVHQDNTPDYGLSTAAWSGKALSATQVRASQPVDQSNFYGTPDLDYDRADQNSVMARVEHDFNRRFTLRNQTRYNKTHREAVVSAITNVAAFNPATEFVTVARQGNDRENQITSNQTNLVGRFATGKLRHAASVGLEFIREEQFAPTLTGLGTRDAVSIYSPNPNVPVTGFALARTAASTSGDTNTAGVYAFDTIEVSNRVQVSGGVRWEHYDTNSLTVDATGTTTADITASRGILSGKASVLYRLTAAGNAYVSYGTTKTPPGTANFSLSAQANNQNNPNVDPQVSTNYEAGTKWDLGGGRASLNASVFHTRNENVIYTIDATAVPPLYNQDDGQKVNGVALGAMGRLTSRWDVLANFAYLDTSLETQTVANNGNRLTLTPKFSSSIWTTVQLPKSVTVGGGIRQIDDVFVNAANTLISPGYHVVDGLAEYGVNKHLTLRVNLYNLTNETYVRSVNNNGGRYNPGYTRSALVTSNITF